MTVRYTCRVCGSDAVQLCYPCWIPARHRDDRSTWLIDDEAQPQKDSDRCYCPDCGDLVSVDEADDDLRPTFRGGSWRIVDPAGGTWWPYQHAHDRIMAAGDDDAKRAECLRLCLNEAGAGRWIL